MITTDHAAAQGKVLIAAPIHEVLLSGLIALGYEPVKMEHITQALAYEVVGDCVGIITSTRLQLNQHLIEAAPMLRWIGRMGSGMEVIDLKYADARGIYSFSSPEGNCNAVAEHALGMLLTLIRRITWSNRELQQGIWKRDENRGTELEGKTIGIIGFGHTGRAFARKLASFDMRLLAYDKYSKNEYPEYVEKCDHIDELFQHADIISFHVPLREDTHHYLNDSFVTSMSKPFVVINTSRGTVVQLQALHRGIISGKIKGACLDVFDPEPISAMNPEDTALLAGLLQLPHYIATPHIAGYTHEALYKMSAVLLEKLKQ